MKRNRKESKSRAVQKSAVKYLFLSRIKFSHIFFLVSLVIFGIVYCYSYWYTVRRIDISLLPLATRDVDYVRVIPEDKGGIVFLNQDKQIYNNIAVPKTPDRVRNANVRAPESKKVMNLITKLQEGELKGSKRNEETAKAEKRALNNVFDVLQSR